MKANFLKELQRVELLYTNISSKERFARYSREVLLLLVVFVESGNFTTSKVSKFLCSNFRLNYSDLVSLWSSVHKGQEKKEVTFRSQVSTLSVKLYAIFGSDVFSIFLNEDKEGLSRLEDLIHALDFGEYVSFNSLFVSELGSLVDGGTLERDFEIKDCKEEVLALRPYKKCSLEESVSELDMDKLLFLKNILNQPLVDSLGGKVLNSKKLELMRQLQLIEKAEKMKLYEESSTYKSEYGFRTLKSIETLVTDTLEQSEDNVIPLSPEKKDKVYQAVVRLFKQLRGRNLEQLLKYMTYSDIINAIEESKG